MIPLLARDITGRFIRIKEHTSAPSKDVIRCKYQVLDAAATQCSYFFLKTESSAAQHSPTIFKRSTRASASKWPKLMPATPSLGMGLGIGLDGILPTLVALVAGRRAPRLRLRLQYFSVKRLTLSTWTFHLRSRFQRFQTQLVSPLTFSSSATYDILFATDSIPSTSSTPTPYGYGLGTPYTGSPDSSSHTYSTDSKHDYHQCQYAYPVPRAPTPSTQFVYHHHQRLESNNYLTVPHAYPGSNHSSRTHSAMGSPALTYAETSVASSPSASPSPAPETMRLYPTVQHATPEPESHLEALFGMEHVNGDSQLEDIKHDAQMEMFLSSLNEGTDSYAGMGQVSYQWGIETGFEVDHGVAVVG